MLFKGVFTASAIFAVAQGQYHNFECTEGPEEDAYYLDRIDVECRDPNKAIANSYQSRQACPDTNQWKEVFVCHDIANGRRGTEEEMTYAMESTESAGRLLKLGGLLDITNIECPNGFMTQYNWTRTFASDSEGFQNDYKCSRGTKVGCEEKLTVCEPFKDQKAEYYDRHHIDCPSGKYLTGFQFTDEGCSGDEARMKYTCCAQSDEISTLQRKLDDYCFETFGARKGFARRDVGTLEQLPQGPVWRCYNESELDFEQSKEENCVDNCGILVSCPGIVADGVSTSHHSHYSQLEGIINENKDSTCDSQAPTQQPTESPTESPTEYPTEFPTESPTEYPTDYPTNSVRCHSVPEVLFAEYWENVDGQHTASLNKHGEVSFHVRGGSTSNVSILLINSATLPEDGAITEAVSAYELFIGGSDEPVVHVSGCAGCAPDAADVRTLETALIKEDAFTVVTVSVSGQVVNVKEGDNVVLTKTFEEDHNIDKVVMQYAHEDAECEV